jgi:glutaconate CoA-transferase subunit B
MTECRPEELLIATLARLLDGCRTIAVGVSSPIPGSAALLAREMSASPVHVDVLESFGGNSFTEGSVELFDRAAQGRVDAFFLGGGQIDGEANINLVGVGGYPQVDVRWPGSFGSAYLYLMVPRVILFREEHTRRVFVPKVDFVSAAGVSEPGIHRPGGPHALVTGMAAFSFDTAERRFALESVHPGHTLEQVVENTGFAFEHGAAAATTALPDDEILATIRGPVAREIATSYPKFAASVFGGAD